MLIGSVRAIFRNCDVWVHGDGVDTSLSMLDILGTCYAPGLFQIWLLVMLSLAADRILNAGRVAGCAAPVFRSEGLTSQSGSVREDVVVCSALLMGLFMFYFGSRYALQ